MVTLEFSVVAKNTNMVLRNSQGIFVVEEYFKTKSCNLCSELFELKFTGVTIPKKSTKKSFI